MIEPTIHTWATFAIIAAAIVSYAWEKVSLEMTSIAVVAVFLVMFQLFPIIGVDGVALDMRHLLAGFADPALFAIMALLVVGQGLVRTGALDDVARQLVTRAKGRSFLVIPVTLVAVMFLSAILNNTPVVVIFIPIVSALAHRLEKNLARVMMPLSFAAILGGNMTLIGSSTNLLVAGSLEATTGQQIGFFDFTVPGLMIAAVGMVFLLFAGPKLIRERENPAGAILSGHGKQFIAEIDVLKGGALDGAKAVAGLFPKLRDVTVRAIKRDQNLLLPPYDDLALAPGDVVVLAATRSRLTELLRQEPESLTASLTESSGDGGEVAAMGNAQTIAEAVISPTSQLVGRTLEQSSFQSETNCKVLGIERRSRMLRTGVESIGLEPGDVLLVIGDEQDVFGLRASSDVLLLEWSAEDIPLKDHSRPALLTFLAIVVTVATGLLPITVAAIAGATFMVFGGCLNIRQAARAIDRRVYLMIGAALAMGTALAATGGALMVAHGLVQALGDAHPVVILGAFFLLIAAMTNVLSNNATAVLFTPIALSVANDLNMDPLVFVVTVIFAANCSFATPMGYQTNLLVMGPGHYKFSDFLRVGIPLIVILWAAFMIIVPWYFDLI